MSRSLIRAAATVTLFVTAACQQTPAQVDLRGQNTYGRNGATTSNFASSNYSYTPSAPVYSAPSNNYATASAPSYVSQSTQQSASVQSIGVSDLAPPSATKTASAAPVAEAKPPVDSAHSVNPWTNKPRVSVEKSDAKPVAQLDSIISKDSAKPKTHSEYGKPVSLITPKEHSSATSGYIWPVNSKKVISGYGPKAGGKVNDGMNIAADEGEPVWAVADGEVLYVGNELSGYGNMVLVKHSGDKTTTYAHLNRATVDKYDRVKQGDIIGYVGTTGNVSKPQLHFAVRSGKEPMDPQKFLKSNVAGL